MKQLNQQLAESTKVYNDQKPLIEETAKLEKRRPTSFRASRPLPTRIKTRTRSR